MKKNEIKVTAEVGNDNKNVKEETLKKGFFKKVWYSITKFEKYPDLAAEGVLKTIKYLVTIMIIFAIIVSAAMTYKTSIYVKKVASYIENDLPNFNYSNEILKFDTEDVIVADKTDLNLGLLIIDTNINSKNEDSQEKIEEYKNLIKDDINQYGFIIMQDKTIAILSSNETNYQYADLINTVGANITEFSKNDAISYFNGNESMTLFAMYFVVMFVYVFAIFSLSVLVDSLMLAALGFITAFCAKLKIKFAAIYNMSVYALTLSIIFNLIYTVVNLFTTFQVVYFQVMYVAIAYIYLAAAIFIIKTDFIKKQAELQKINEEQKKVRDELIKQEDKKQKENKKDEKEPKDEKDGKKENKKKKDEKDNNLGETPGESNA